MGNLFTVEMFRKTGKVDARPYIPVRFWLQFQRDEKGKFVLDQHGEKIVKNRKMVVFLGDTARFYFNKGENKGRFEERIVKPYRTIDIAQGEHRPRLGGRDHLRAVEGSFQKVTFADEEDRIAMCLTSQSKKDRDSGVVYVKVRCGWYPDYRGSITRALVDHIQDQLPMGLPGSFLFGGEDDTLEEGVKEVTEDQIKNLDRSNPLVGGWAIHHGLYRLRKGAFIIGMEHTGIMWKLENTREGVVIDDGENYREDYLEKVAERKEVLKKQRVEARKRKKDQRLAVQQAESDVEESAAMEPSKEEGAEEAVA